jgi:hypothetical protein
MMDFFKLIKPGLKYSFVIFYLIEQYLFVLYESTTAVEIPLNDEMFGMFYGSHIRK